MENLHIENYLLAIIITKSFIPWNISDLNLA